MRLTIASILLSCSVASLASAQTPTPLAMSYAVTPVPGGFNYEFTLSLTNTSGTWSAGQGFGWVIWGDAQGTTSPINDFVGDPADLPVGPFVCYSGSSGHHNGPTFCVGHDAGSGFALDYWVPAAIGDSLRWSGTSATDLPNGQMLWSNLIANGGATYSEWNIATREGSGCAADFNGDGIVDFFDYLDFVAAFSANAPAADFNGDSVIDFFDYLDFVAAFAAGC